MKKTWSECQIGRSNAGNLALLANPSRQHGIWDAAEVPGDFYRRVELSDAELDDVEPRLEALEAQL